MSGMDIKFSVVIPVYKSSRSLPELVERINKVFSEVVRESYEIVMVDDGSPLPETWKTLESLAEKNDFLKAIQLTRNFGRAGALLCGLENAQGEFIITMDDDLQHRPEDIPLLLEKKEHDVVFGNFKWRKHSLFVRITSEIKGLFDKLIIGRPRGIKVSSFNMIKADIVRSMLGIKTPYPFIPALMFYVTKDAVSVYVTHERRIYGASGFTLWKRINQFLRLLINNSSLLLKSVAAIGLAMATFSTMYSIYLIINKFYQRVHVSGWTSLMVAILITSGLILFSLGVVGEYLIRIINGIEERPPFIIRKKVDRGDKC